ncbi:CapA family protein [Sphingomonas psychrotolerans]|uniref:CapA family protein n=1 Tax=Sphingomonas psychrotolerans TaxID=1327635 RepID=UPI001F43B7A9|nr:CapA family protein [Sphingomonas psychrotolerans]
MIGSAIFTALSIGPASAQEALVTAPVPTTPTAGEFTLAAVGDLIYLRPMLATLEARSPDMLRLLRGADVTFGNFETTVLDLATTKAVAQAESGGTWMLADPRVPDDVAALGFDIVSHANNHSTDWGVEGMAETGRRLTDARLIWSGTGASLSAARAPRYIDVAKGRIGLVSATSTFTPMSRASDAAGEVAARPGVNSIRTVRTALVTPEQLDVLAAIAAKSPLRTDGRSGEAVTLFGNRFASGATSGKHLDYRYRINAGDLSENLRAIRQAKQNGNFVIYSVHNHEPGNDFQEPADFAVELARKAIDAGADAYMGHGPHQLRGIEIYKGKPIFYSLGNFAMMNNSLDAVPADMYDQFGVSPDSATVPELLQARNARTFSDPNLYESVIALSRYSGGRLAEIKLYPIDLGVDVKGADRGVPRMAARAHGDKILGRLQTLSAALGTTIRIENGIGVIRVAPPTQASAK